MRLFSSFATRLLLSAFLSLYAAVSFAQTTAISGIWKDNSENYWAFIQDKNSSTVAATRISFDFTTLQAFLGKLEGSSLDVTELFGNSAQLTATIDSSGTSFSGEYKKSPSSEPLSMTADQVFAYQGSEYDGVWQNDAGHYLLYITAQTAGTKIVVVVDLILNETQDGATSVVYVGATSGTNFVGTELKTGSGSKNTLRLAFDTTGTGTGSYVVASVPPKVTSFSMTRIVEASGNVALSTP